MSYVNLIPVENVPFPFFDEPTPSAEKYCKIYHDGGHFVATTVLQQSRKPTQHNHVRKDIDIMFDSLFFEATSKGLNNIRKKGQMTNYIKAGLETCFADYPDLDGYIEHKIKRAYHNLGVRKKRFRRKAYLNRWNYFVTFTFDDKKHSPESFRQKLRKCLCNLHTRRGWRYMGVFERAPETGRLHFHGLLYVPDGEMIGRIVEKKDYSTAQGKIQVTHSNDFFAESFGRNDFEEMNEMALTHGHMVDYILKYIEKQGERIVYSRGIPTEVCKQLTDTDIITTFVDYVEKFVLFDDIVDWEEDVIHYSKRGKQMTMIDLICNPPRVT